MIGFGFTSDWILKWREIFKPIVWGSKAKQCDTQNGSIISHNLYNAFIDKINYAVII